ncbi:MAG TPA: deoxyguanosinetriphosphate triphosphohydrolase, partial [Burkholderiales bacterium]|nr:deoxyguanosinetriphosphate triphosphohydrolase [Burkholderiales bacterium]
LVTDLIETTRGRLAGAGIGTIEDVRGFAEPLVGFSDTVGTEHLGLKRFLRRNLYAHEHVRSVTDAASGIVKNLFSAFMRDTNLLPSQYREKLQGDDAAVPAIRARVVADYLAGMTDRYAYREYDRLGASAP